MDQEQITAQIAAQVASTSAKVIADAAIAAAVLVAKENSAAMTAIAVLQTKMNTIERLQTAFETAINKRMDDLGLKFEKVFDRLDEIAQGRPTWGTTLILSGLFSLCVGLITFMVR
jgi:hypothetical protein